MAKIWLHALQEKNSIFVNNIKRQVLISILRQERENNLSGFGIWECFKKNTNFYKNIKIAFQLNPNRHKKSQMQFSKDIKDLNWK